MALRQAAQPDPVAVPDGRGALASLVAWARDEIGLGGRFGLSFPADRYGQIYVTPWRDRERFFSDGHGIAPIESADTALRDFLTRHAKGMLCYGYPVRVDADGTVTPLLYCEVGLRLGKSGSVQVVKSRERRPRLHHRLLIEAGLDHFAVDTLVERIEHGDFASFAECLVELAAAIGGDPAAFAPEALAAPPDGAGRSLAPGWHSLPVLHVAPPSTAQRLLLEELDALPAAFEAAELPTALHAMLEPAATLDRAAVAPAIEAYPMTEGLAAVLEACLSTPLTVIEAPPGSGKLALVANLIASMIGGARSVLYVSPHRHVIDHLTGRFQSMVNRDQDWIVRLGTTRIRQRLTDTMARLSLRLDEPRWRKGETVTLRQLAELRQGVAAARRQIDPVRKAHQHFASRQRWRRSLEMEILEPWLPLFDASHRLDADLAQIEHCREQARSFGRSGAAGLRHAVRRRMFGKQVRDGLFRTLTETLRPLPDWPRQALLALAHPHAQRPDAFAFLAEAFDHLARFLLWQKALVNEDQAFETLLRAPSAASIEQQLNEAQTAVSRGARMVLRETWRGMLFAELGRVGEKLNSLFGLIERRAQGAARSDPGAQRDLARAIGGLTRPFPFWTVAAEDAPGLLPLTDGLFDLVIIDDADRLSAGALLPLLLRGRRAVVLGSLAELRTARSDGFAVAIASTGGAHQPLGELVRSHPHIAEYLNQTFHGGRLRLHADAGAAPQEFGPALVGLHWHDVDSGAPPAGSGGSAAAEIAATAALLASWHEAGVFAGSGGGGPSVGIVTPVLDEAEALHAAVAAVLPGAVMRERIAFGPPERFQEQLVDLLIVLPGIARSTPAAHARRLAANRMLYHDAIGAARIGVHVVGDAASCRVAGGLAGALLEHCETLAVTVPVPAGGDGTGMTGMAEPLGQIASLLDRVGLCYRPSGSGLLAFTRFGGLYAVTPLDRAESQGLGDEDKTRVPILVDMADLTRMPHRTLRRFERLV